MKNKIKNYTTDVPAAKTIMEISEILVKAKARGIASEYDDQGNIKAIFFRIMVDTKELSFKLPAKPESVYKVLFAGMHGEWTYKEQRMEKATNIAWRIVKDWLEAQVALIQLEQAEAAEVFFPYLLVAPNKTIFEQAKENQFLLGSGG